MHDLRLLGLEIDLSSKSAENPKLMAAATESYIERITPSKRKQPDTTSGIDESDTKLVQEGKKVFDACTTHLSGARAHILWGILEMHAQCWLRPRAGRVNFIEASSEVEGRPVKAKLRPLQPELRVELDKHLGSMLAAGVIRPSGSPWGAASPSLKK